VVFQFLKILIFRKVFCKIVIIAEGIQIDKYAVAIQFARILNADMVRICVHTHDFLADHFRFICQINAVAQRFTHLGLAICTRETHTCLILRKQSLWLHQNFIVSAVKTADDLSGLFDHRKLVFAHRYDVCLESSNIGSLADRICKETYRDAGLEAAHLNLTFYRRVTLQAGNGYQVAVVKSQFSQFRYIRLNEKI